MHKQTFMASVLILLVLSSIAIVAAREVFSAREVNLVNSKLGRAIGISAHKEISTLQKMAQCPGQPTTACTTGIANSKQCKDAIGSGDACLYQCTCNAAGACSWNMIQVCQFNTCQSSQYC